MLNKNNYEKIDKEINNDKEINKLRNEMFEERKMMTKLEDELYSKYNVDFPKARRNHFVMYLGGKEKFQPSDRDIEQHRYSHDDRHFMIDPIYKELEELNLSIRMKNQKVENLALEIKRKHRIIDQQDMIDEQYDGYDDQ